MLAASGCCAVEEQKENRERDPVEVGSNITNGSLDSGTLVSVVIM